MRQTKRSEMARKRQKTAPSKRGKRQKPRVDHRCECGRVEIADPANRLEMCEACQVCGRRVHTVADRDEHERLHATPPPVSEEPTVEDGKAASRRKTKDRRSVAEREAAEAEFEALTGGDTAPRWAFFFTCQRYPMLRSQLITAIMSGTSLCVERINKHMLLDVVLLATACREFHNAEIVDDFQGLLDRTEEEWRRPEWTCRVFSSIHAGWANFIINHGTRDFIAPETRYIPALAGWLLEHDAPAYFSEELTDDEVPVKKVRRRV